MNLQWRRAYALTVLTLAATLGCDTAGAGRTLGVSAASVVQGFVYFDADGSGAFGDADQPIAGARIRLLAPAGTDTLLRATTGADGRFRLASVPVGSYRIVLLDVAPGQPLTLESGAALVAVVPDDSLELIGALRYPHVSAAGLQTAALDDRVFVSGVALHALATFSDTLLHVVDTSGAVRAVRVRPTAVTTGDSVRLRGRVAQREGRRVLEDVTVFPFGTAVLPPAPLVGTGVAATGGDGTLDAMLVRLLDAAVVDTQSVQGSLRVRVDDGSGVVTMLLDRAADVSFRPPFAPGAWDAGRRYDIVGVLVPGPTGWTVRPRSALDLTPR